MIAVNELIQNAFSGIGMVGVGESADDDYPKVAENELNVLVSTLNSEGYISLAQKEIDMPPAYKYYFRKLVEGEELPRDTVDMEPPEKIDALARAIGQRWLPIPSMDPVQMSVKIPTSLPTGWTYYRELEEGPDAKPREVGVVKLNGNPMHNIRFWISSKLPRYQLDGFVYLSDLYNSMLLAGLKWRLACYFELSDQKKQDCLNEFKDAKSLIKRNTVTQRMIRSGAVGDGYDDAYWDGRAGSYWG